MSVSEIRMGILGSGSMGSAHAECLREFPKVEVVGVFSRDRVRAAGAARICGAKATTDPMELIDEPSIDAIDVCLPSLNHRQFVATESYLAGGVAATATGVVRCAVRIRPLGAYPATWNVPRIDEQPAATTAVVEPVD